MFEQMFEHLFAVPAISVLRSYGGKEGCQSKITINVTNRRDRRHRAPQVCILSALPLQDILRNIPRFQRNLKMEADSFFAALPLNGSDSKCHAMDTDHAVKEVCRSYDRDKLPRAATTVDNRLL